jgi:hypothetical protein
LPFVRVRAFIAVNAQSKSQLKSARAGGGIISIEALRSMPGAPNKTASNEAAFIRIEISL